MSTWPLPPVSTRVAALNEALKESGKTANQFCAKYLNNNLGNETLKTPRKGKLFAKSDEPEFVISDTIPLFADVVYDENISHKRTYNYTYDDETDLFGAPILPEFQESDLPSFSLFTRVNAWNEDEMEMMVGQVIDMKNLCGIWNYQIDPEDTRTEIFWSFNVTKFD